MKPKDDVLDRVPFPGTPEHFEVWKRHASWKIAAASVFFIASSSLMVVGFVNPDVVDFATKNFLGPSLGWVGYFTVNAFTLALSTLRLLRGYKDAQLLKSLKDNSCEPLQLTNN